MRIKLFLLGLLSFTMVACSEHDSPVPTPEDNTVVNKVEFSWIKDSVLTIPTNYQSISDSVFKGLSSFKEVKASSIIRMGAGAFKDCSKLTKISALNLSKIGDKAFMNTPLLKTVELGTVPTVGTDGFDTPFIDVVSPKSPQDFKNLKQFFYSVNGTPIGTIYDGMKGTYVVFNPGYTNMINGKVIPKFSENAWVKVFNWKGEEVAKDAFKDMGYDSHFVKYGDYYVFWSCQKTWADWSRVFQVRVYSAQDFSIVKQFEVNTTGTKGLQYASTNGIYMLSDGSLYISAGDTVYPLNSEPGVDPTKRIDVDHPLFKAGYANNFIVTDKYVLAWSYFSSSIYVYNLKTKAVNTCNTIHIEDATLISGDKVRVYEDRYHRADYNISDCSLIKDGVNEAFIVKQYKGFASPIGWYGKDATIEDKKIYYGTQESGKTFYDVAFHKNVPQVFVTQTAGLSDLMYIGDLRTNQWKLVNSGGKRTKVWFNN